MKLYNATHDAELGEVRIADSFFSRLRGMLGVDPGKGNYFLWFVPCNSLHMFGMTRKLDMIFLDKEMRIVQINKGVRPFCPGVICVKAHSVMETFTGFWDSSKLAVGDTLRLAEN